MSDSLISGAAAVVDMVVDILKNHWQTAVTAIATDLALGYTLTTPDSTHGYSKSRVLPRDSSPSCEVFVDGVGVYGQRLVNVGAARRMTNTVRVRIRWSPKDRALAETDAQVYASAARQVIMQRWRAYHSTGSIKARVVDLEVETDESASSIGQRGQAEGLTDYGRGYESNDETIELIVKFDHFVNHPISFS